MRSFFSPHLPHIAPTYSSRTAMTKTSWEKEFFFTSCIPIPSRSTYIMPNGDTRRSQSAIFFNSKSKQGEEKNNWTSKRKREEQTPNILVGQTSTCTLVNEDTKQMASALQQTPATNKNKEQVALKLNRLKDKVTRYESHKDFLTRCIAEKLNPKGLKFELETTI